MSPRILRSGEAFGTTAWLRVDDGFTMQMAAITRPSAAPWRGILVGVENHADHAAHGRTLYTASQVERIKDPETRKFLTHQGLPAVDLILEEDSSAGPIDFPDGTEAVCFGNVAGGRLCVDPETGEVFVAGDFRGAKWHVNKTIQQFALSLEKFDSMYPFYPRNSEDGVIEEAVARFSAALDVIDDTALGSPGTHWNNIMFDIGNGDYGDEG